MKNRQKSPIPALITVAIALALFSLHATAAQTAPQKPTPPKLYTNIFLDTDIREALQDIASQMEVTIVTTSDVTGFVTCELKDAPLDKALQAVLAGTGNVVKKTPEYYLISSPEPTSASFPAISETRLVKLGYAKPDVAVNLLSSRFKDYAQPDTDRNLVCVTAPPELMERITADLKLIDQPPRQVMLDARIVVIESGNLLNLGLKWNWPQAKGGVFSNAGLNEGPELTGAKWPWGVQIGYTPDAEFTDSLLLTLNLLAQNEDATVVANPQLMAQDGKEAQIKVTNEEYFKILTEEAYYIRSTLEQIEVGTTLKITPRVGDNGDITLDLTAEVSDVIARGEEGLPVVTRRVANSTVRVENGGTAAVAGLVDSRSRLTHSHVPGLGSVPVVGRVFRDDARSESSRQVAVFVTARLLPEGEEAPAEVPQKREAITPVGKEFRKALEASLARSRQGGQ